MEGVEDRGKQYAKPLTASVDPRLVTKGRFGNQNVTVVNENCCSPPLDRSEKDGNKVHDMSGCSIDPKDMTLRVRCDTKSFGPSHRSAKVRTDVVEIRAMGHGRRNQEPGKGIRSIHLGAEEGTPGSVTFVSCEQLVDIDKLIKGATTRNRGVHIYDNALIPFWTWEFDVIIGVVRINSSGTPRQVSFTHSSALGSAEVAFLGIDKWFIENFSKIAKSLTILTPENLQHIFSQKELNMRYRRWIELFSDYNCEIRYHPGKTNESSIKDRTLMAQKEAVDESAGLQKGLDEMIKLRNDGVLYYLDQIWYWWLGMKKVIANMLVVFDLLKGLRAEHQSHLACSDTT
ncbi:hypothetical protein Tco_0478907 [Tanacetum coccineum]